MNLLYLLSVWIHIIAAMVWIGGMLFLVLVVVPWLRSGHRAQAAVFFRETGARFRNIGWTCFLLLAITGAFNLWVRGVRCANFVDPQWLTSPFGTAVLAKLSLFVVVLLVSAVHDFLVGPRATRAIAADPRSSEAQRERRRASSLGRANVVFALLLVAMGVVLVRGSPW